MPPEIKREVKLEIVHVLFVDIVGYSTRLTDEQQALIDQLNQVVRNSAVFQKATAADRLIKIPTGDGTALIFYNSPEQPVECALEISRELKSFPELSVRMGVHSGPVSAVTDLNDRTNAAGIGINVAQRVMDCGDSGHILISQRVAEDLQQYGRWRKCLHDLGEVEVKHGTRIHVFNLYADGAGNPDLPDKLRLKAAEPAEPTPAPARPARKAGPAREGVSICVLPFSNMSGDAEQEYFSDGISEDIITDLSNVSALHIISRNTAFTFKGKPVDVRQVATQLNVSHVLEGSVRKAGGRVRITAQLIDGSNDSHVWAERYDRDLNDIFALQDEISRAIVDALKVKLLPEEKKAIEKHGTENVDAYNLYLMARQAYATGFEGDNRRNQVIVRLCRRATEIDPHYADAWAMIALAEMLLGSTIAHDSEGGLSAAERALSLNPDLAEAHAVKARILWGERREEAFREIEMALRLDPESHEVNKCAGVLRFRQGRLEEAIRYFEKALALEDMDFASAGLLITCYTALGQKEATRRAAEVALVRVEKVLAQDPNNGSAMGHGSDALAVLGQGERAKEWMGRALLIDPENVSMRYNFACALATHLKDNEAALDMLGPAFERMNGELVHHAKVDPDLSPLRDHPRFQAILAAAEARTAQKS